MSISKTLVIPERVKTLYKKSQTPARKQVAEEVFYRLPREIRNRVYTYCVQGLYDNEVIVRRGFGANGSCAFLVRCRRPSEHSCQWVEDPIASVIDAEQVGADVAREMLETYYWTRVFKFSQYESAVLGAFLTTDKFGLNLYPAEYARHLHLTLQPPKYVATAPVKGPSDFNKCLATVEALTAVHAARLQVVFDMDLTDCVEDETDRAMPLLIVENMVKNLNARGLRAKIAYRNCWEE